MGTFQADKVAGAKAEAFIEEYGKSLLFPPDDPRIVLMLKRFEPEQGYFTNWPEHITNDAPIEFGEMRKTDEEIHIEGGDFEARIMNPQITEMEYGWIEVKASNNNALIRFGSDNIPSVPFEIYSNVSKKTPGWLWHFTHLKDSLEQRKLSRDGLRTLTPSAMIFCQYEGIIGATPPYAVISFYDFPALLTALIDIAQMRYGWDIVNWQLTSKTEPQNTLCKREVIGANWNVRLDWLREKNVPMAIYLLGNPPLITRDSYYAKNMTAWENLKKMATAQYELDQLKGTHEGI